MIFPVLFAGDDDLIPYMRAISPIESVSHTGERGNDQT